MPDPKELVANPAWFPWRFAGEGEEIVFARLSRRDIASAPFLDMRLDVKSRDLARVAWENVEAELQLHSLHPANRFILHSSFCGSTLMTRALDALGGWIALREPISLLSVANFRRLNRPVARDTERWQRLVLGLLHLLGRGPDGQERTVVKPTNTANGLAPDLLRMVPGARVVVMYSTLRSFLVSVLGRGEKGWQFGRHVVELALHDITLPNITHKTLVSIDQDQTVGLAWYVQLEYFKRLAEQFDRSSLVTLQADKFHSRPASTLSSVTAYLGSRAPQESVQKVVEGQPFDADAKGGTAHFRSEDHEFKRNRIERQLEPRLTKVENWLAGQFGDPPVPLPLSQALI